MFITWTQRAILGVLVLSACRLDDDRPKVLTVSVFGDCLGEVHSDSTKILCRNFAACTDAGTTCRCSAEYDPSGIGEALYATPLDPDCCFDRWSWDDCPGSDPQCGIVFYGGDISVTAFFAPCPDAGPADAGPADAPP